MSSQTHRDEWWMVPLVGVVALALLLTGCAELAAMVAGGHHWLPFDPLAGAVALAHFGDPRLAWPTADRADVPAAAAYWTVTILVLGGLAAGVATGVSRLRPGAGRGKSALRTRPTSADLRAMGEQAARRQARRLRPGGVESPHSHVRGHGILLGTSVHRRHPLYATWEDSLLVIGPPRSGKTTSLVIPMVVEAPGAVVTTSTRPDVWQAVRDLRGQAGPVVAFDPSALAADADQLRWSPIRGCEDPAVALRRARAMSSAIDMGGVKGGDFWSSAAADVLAGVLHAAALAEATPSQLLGWVGSPKALTIPAQILQVDPRTAPGWAERLSATAANPAQQTTGSILATAAQALAPLADPDVLSACSPPPGEGFDAGQLIASHATVCLLATPGGSNPAPLLSALLTDLTETARAIAAKSPGGRLDPPLLLQLDEAANICPLPDLPSLLAAGGGDGIVACLILQSLEQARSRWGQAAAGAMVDAATAKLILPGLSQPRDLADLAALAGEVEERETSTTSGGSGRSTTTSTRTRPALRPDQLRSLPEGHAMLIPRRTAPVEVVLTPTWKRSWGASRRR